MPQAQQTQISAHNTEQKTILVFSITNLKSALKRAGSGKYSPPILEPLQRKSTGLDCLEEKTQTKHALHYSFFLSDNLPTFLALPVKLIFPAEK